ncbi:hypothetical protein AT261_23630 [Bacillus cereus]|uniref:hypothetical protein n=1 Tax=unclassified Bacillus (in: firmicutes) TaxID=185979 RepID=UPI00077A1F07|nr:hypothetical protein AT261_23630 [Bacillus cereus]
MSLPLSRAIVDQLSESEKQTIEQILLIMGDVKIENNDGCRDTCEISATIGNAGCDAMSSPIARAACRLAVKVAKDICIKNCGS